MFQKTIGRSQHKSKHVFKNKSVVGVQLHFFSEKKGKSRHFYLDIQDEMIENENYGREMAKEYKNYRPKLSETAFVQLNHDLTNQLKLKEIVDVEFERKSRKKREKKEKEKEKEKLSWLTKLNPFHNVDSFDTINHNINNNDHTNNDISNDINNDINNNGIGKGKNSLKQIETGNNDQIYSHDSDSMISMFRIYTWTPFTLGIVVVPFIINRYPELDMHSKILIGAMFQLSSLIFPWMSHRAVRDIVLRVWMTPTKDKLIVEKRGFWFGLYTQEYRIANLKPLYTRGNERHCWFACTKTKRKFMLVNEKMEHPLWFQLLGIKQHDISSMTHQILFSETQTNK